MLATITALWLGIAGTGLGAAGCFLAARAGSRQRAILGRVDQLAQIALVTNDLAKHSIATARGQEVESNQFFAVLSSRLDDLEITATEQLITRGEVSQAFAELAAIEEQRQRQAMAARATQVADVPATIVNRDPGAAQQGDPWASSQAPVVVSPSTLIDEITAMNERLREKLRGAGVLQQS